MRMTVPRSITLRDLLEALRELDVVDRVSNRGNVLSTSLDVHARRERRVALRIERLGLRHAARHPQHDDGVGGGAPRRLRLRGAHELRLAAGERRERRGGRRAHESASAQARVDEPFVFRHDRSGVQ